MGIKTSLLKGLDDQEKMEVKDGFSGSAAFREALRKHIAEKITSEQKNSRDPAKFDSPNWSLSQANSVGFERGLDYVLNLII